MITDRYHEMVAAIPDIGGNVQHALDGAGVYVLANQDAFAVATIISIAAISLIAAYRLVLNKPVDKAEQMRKRLILDRKYADGIHDMLLDMYDDGEIDKHEYKKACRRFGIGFRLPDLLVTKSRRHGLRNRVRGAIKAMHQSPSVIGKIPGPKIGSEVPASFLVIKPSAPQRKVWIVTGKAPLRRKSAQ